MARAALLIILAGLLTVEPLCLCSAETGPAAKPPAPDTDSIRRWQEMRFGMFIHWGPVSLKGTEIGWSRGREVPEDEYDQLYTKFNPTRFSADEWVEIAKAAGMKYLVITSKHHDGFCLWDSKLTEYDILINNRVDKGRRGMQGATISDEFVGDYDTPEQQVGGFNRQRPWETCMTIGRIVAKLEELGVRDNTLILFTSDNGGAYEADVGPSGGCSDSGAFRCERADLDGLHFVRWRPPSAV